MFYYRINGMQAKEHCRLSGVDDKIRAGKRRSCNEDKWRKRKLLFFTYPYVYNTLVIDKTPLLSILANPWQFYWKDAKYRKFWIVLIPMAKNCAYRRDG